MSGSLDNKIANWLGVSGLAITAINTALGVYTGARMLEQQRRNYEFDREKFQYQMERDRADDEEKPTRDAAKQRNQNLMRLEPLHNHDTKTLLEAQRKVEKGRFAEARILLDSIERRYTGGEPSYREFDLNYINVCRLQANLAVKNQEFVFALQYMQKVLEYSPAPSVEDILLCAKYLDRLPEKKNEQNTQDGIYILYFKALIQYGLPAEDSREDLKKSVSEARAFVLAYYDSQCKANEENKDAARALEQATALLNELEKLKCVTSQDKQKDLDSLAKRFANLKTAKTKAIESDESKQAYELFQTQLKELPSAQVPVEYQAKVSGIATLAMLETCLREDLNNPRPNTQRPPVSNTYNSQESAHYLYNRDEDTIPLLGLDSKNRSNDYQIPMTHMITSTSSPLGSATLKEDCRQAAQKLHPSQKEKLLVTIEAAKSTLSAQTDYLEKRWVTNVLANIAAKHSGIKRLMASHRQKRRRILAFVRLVSEQAITLVDVFQLIDKSFKIGMGKHAETISLKDALQQRRWGGSHLDPKVRSWRLWTDALSTLQGGLGRAVEAHTNPVQQINETSPS